MAQVAVSCVIDDHPTFLMQGWNWLCSLDRLRTRDRADIFIHYADSLDPTRLSIFEDLGARLVPIAPFGHGRARYCNKVRQLETEALRGYEHVILTDADVVFADCPTQFATGSAVRGKLVDLDNPPEPVWRALFTEAGLEDAIRTAPLDLVPETSFATNFNGGFYVVPGAAIESLGKGWDAWARFCLAHAELLGDKAVHADQLGFGMAVLEAHLDVDYLGLEANFPLHLRRFHRDIRPRPLATIHYHRQLDHHGLLTRVGVPWIDEQVDDVNAGLVAARREHLDNRIFWDFRYHNDPGLGSGIGSRGRSLTEKRALLLPYFRAFADKTVLDVGCGDLEATRHMPVQNYRGLDVSASALDLARAKRPDWQFDTSTLDTLAPNSYDLVTCIDVLLHQSDPADIHDIVEHLVRVAKDAVIVSGYTEPITPQGIVFYSGALQEQLAGVPDVREVIPIGRYRDVDLLVAVKKSSSFQNANDISLPLLAYGMMRTPDWRLLNELVALSRSHLGYFPKTVIRSIEYPWFAGRLERHSGEPVLDIGAGVSVLPIWLAEQGCYVSTVDNHPRVRHSEDPAMWNEWGFLDYAMIDPRIDSSHSDASTYESDQAFGAIYSVSVLEHVPSTVRRDILTNARQLLAPHGCLYLSFDLVPGTRELWRYSEGTEVEAGDAHGTVDDVLEELASLDLAVTEFVTMGEIRNSRTDLAMVACRRRDG